MTGRRRPFWVDGLLLGLSAVMVAVFVLLGNWQVHRLAWKRDLIEAVDTRAHGAPVAPPANADFDPALHEYLRVTVEGSFLPDASLLVKAVTDLGPGSWVMTPLDTGDRIIWINRGFVPPDRRDPVGWYWPDPPVEITGLIRADQPGGTLLEKNRPEIDRWVSRDLALMSETAGVGATAPFFIDADPGGPPDSYPRGGLTVIKFRNSHLSYALTWYAMALLFTAALVFVIRGRLHLSDD